MTRIISYSRVSTDEQAREGVSIEAQPARIQQYASLYGLEIVETIVDGGQSAKNLKRPGIQRALKLLREGAADGICVAKLDRLTRSLRDWQTLIDEFFGEKSGKQLFSVDDSIDTQTPAGRMVLNIILSVSQWEREAIASRTKSALQHKIKKGERVGKILFGYTLGDDGKSLVPDAKEQEAIALMNQLRHEGYSFRAIGDALASRGIESKEGGAWQASSIQKILKRHNAKDHAA